jgi:RNA recognition motif-containing protein
VFSDDLKLDPRERRDDLRRDLNKMTNTLYVANLPFATTTEDLRALFAPAGAVIAVELLFDRMTGRAQGSAFVAMATEEEARRAIEKFDGSDAFGRSLKVDAAQAA